MTNPTLFMIHFTFILFGKMVFAQINNDLNKLTIEEAFRPKMPAHIDTLYYPFYNGVQMIEVDHIGYWDKKIFFLEQSNPRAMPHSMFHPMPIGNEFLFRDTTGVIVKAFNNQQSLDELTRHFKNIPITYKNIGSLLSPYHSGQDTRNEGVWYQSPQRVFNFSGHYKVSTGTAKQESTDYPQRRPEGIKELKFGLIDSLGNIVIPLLYDEIFPFYGNLLVQKNNKWGIINYEQTEVVPLKYDNYKVDEYTRSVNREGNVNVFFLTSKNDENDKSAYSYDALFLTKESKLIPLNDYDELYSGGIWISGEGDANRYMYVTKNGKRGLLNSQFEEVIPPQYEIFDYHGLNQGLFRVAKEGKFGFWDKAFKQVISLHYDYAENFGSDSIALVFKNGEFYCIDKQGKRQDSCSLSPKWKIGHLGFLMDENYVRVYTNDLCGILDTSSNTIVLPIKYNKALTPVELNRFLENSQPIFKQMKLEYSGSPDMYGEILFHNNRIIVKNENNRYGLIDTSFRVLIDFVYEDFQAVQYNLKYLIYSHNGNPGVIDFSGKEVLSYKYDEIRYDTHYKQEWDICKVKKNGKWGVVDFEDKILVPCEYDSIRFLGHWNRPRIKLWIVEKNKKYGVVNDKNELFIPFEYDGISHLEGNNLWVEDKNKKRYKVVLRE